MACSASPSLCSSSAPWLSTQDGQENKRIPLLDPTGSDLLIEGTNYSGGMILNFAEISARAQFVQRSCPERCVAQGIVCLCALLRDDLQEGFLGTYTFLLRLAQRLSSPEIHVAEEICFASSVFCGHQAGISAGGGKDRGQEGRAGQMESTEHPSLSDLCCHSKIFILFVNTCCNEY